MQDSQFSKIFSWIWCATSLLIHVLCISVADEPSGSSNADSLALMEFYMKKAAQEEKFRQPKQSKDEMPPPASLQGSNFDGDCY